MALADLDALSTAMASPTQRIIIAKNVSIGGTSSHWNSAWLSGGFPAAGVAPGASVVPTNATVGSLGQGNKSGTEQRAWMRRLGLGGLSGTNMFAQTVMLIDRLVHMSGLDGTNTGAQTVSTSALTRYTSGEGVFAAAEIYTGIGTSGGTITASYTNQAGTAARVAQPVDFGVSGRSTAGTFCPLSLQVGDKGVRAVANATLSGSSGTAGNFGITLYKPLAIWPCITGLGFPNNGDPIKFAGGANMPVIENDACLSLVFFGIGAISATSNFELDFFED